jgi:hypothetical protein
VDGDGRERTGDSTAALDAADALSRNPRDAAGNNLTDLFNGILKQFPAKA